MPRESVPIRAGNLGLDSRLQTFRVRIIRRQHEHDCRVRIITRTHYRKQNRRLQRISNPTGSTKFRSSRLITLDTVGFRFHAQTDGSLGGFLHVSVSNLAIQLENDLAVCRNRVTRFGLHRLSSDDSTRIPNYMA